MENNKDDVNSTRGKYFILIKRTCTCKRFTMIILYAQYN